MTREQRDEHVRQVRRVWCRLRRVSVRRMAADLAARPGQSMARLRRRTAGAVRALAGGDAWHERPSWPA
jgi:hypothetical protein